MEGIDIILLAELDPASTSPSPFLLLFYERIVFSAVASVVVIGQTTLYCVMSM